MTALRKTSVSASPAPSAPPGKIVLMHAFGGDTGGDSLLVDLSIRLVRDALGPKPSIVIHAAETQSYTGQDFSKMGHVVEVPGFSGSIFDKLAGCTRIAAGLSGEKFEFRGGFPDLEKVDPSLIIGVGGGYLRAGTRLESIKTTLAHLPQVLWAANQPVPSIYLPQSIGPLASRAGRRLRDAIERVDHLFVRDDRTASLFMHHDGLRRAPDLALMELADRLPTEARDSGHERLYLAAGRLPRNPRQLAGYAERIQRLRELMPDAELLLDGDAKLDDVGLKFYRSLGWTGPFRTVGEVLDRGPRGVMVSVGLGNSLEAMLAGWPTVHLATERKAFGAFADMNLSHCIRKATCFDPQEVANIATSLRFGRAAFWRNLTEARASFADAREEMMTLIAKSYLSGQKRRRALA